MLSSRWEFITANKLNQLIEIVLSSAPANMLQIYEQPDRTSKSINYQPTSGKEQFWVAKRTADQQWMLLGGLHS
ncbi:hypothetical protein [Proteus mirabilis]|uniref:Uncharacterized protein n=1 Tax=Providencia rustigianii DSM 4541 TaxID=500637 RepID=D1P3I6_9GAMM|nr:hypothetical protein [Proteus mirabilis]EFB72102.1 hypothetical protein PROVRUST_06857 [Providencia rustigianii DSM 4541]MCU9563848.1 hypothetical protein [Proteus mirabilis]